jgi:UDP-N-acetylglucosamine/UDP-N-acetylgalactosamine diphosphorylase
MPPPQELAARLARHHQTHLAHGWDALTDAGRAALAAQLDAINFDELAALHAARDASAGALPPREAVAPVPVVPARVTADVHALGEAALARGEVAVLLVAGGQGTRLGFDKPKGAYAVGPVSGASLFQIHAEKVLATARAYGRPVPFLVMTSDATHADTVAYFAEHAHFGLPREDVYFFQQGTMPAVDIATGRVLLEAPGRPFLSPNGHGGTLTAVASTGVLEAVAARGVKHVFYFQVDNPLVKVCCPEFVGSHIAAASEASAKVVFKERPEEKVGVFAAVNGRCAIIEYSDMPAEMAAERETDGALRYRAGNPAIHLFSVEFLRRVTGKGGLAYHVARKKVPHWNPETGASVTPTSENALKFELFVFDALPLADRWLVMETSRAEEFSPLKNATGTDSPATVRGSLIELHAGWLERAGARVPRGADGAPAHAVEVSPLFALDEAACAAKVAPGTEITGPTYLR